MHLGLSREARFCSLLERWKTNPVLRSDVETYQLFKLAQTLQYVFEKSSFYRDRFSRAGIRPADLRSLQDLSRFPLTEPENLAESPYRFLCLSRAEIARCHTFVTSGTTGPQKKVFWTDRDLERITDFMAAGIGMVADTTDVVQICLPDGRPNSQADLLFKGVQKLGAVPVIAGMDFSPRRHLDMIEKSESTILFGYTLPLFRLSKELEAMCDLRSRRVKTLYLAGEYVPDAMRRELRKIWGCEVRTHYGLTEMGLGVAVECEAGDGYHFNEAGLLLEIVDPDSGATVPPGEEGEMVFTTLYREAMPLIRFRTHDISRIITEPCPCGAASLLKIDKVRKRLESIVVLEGGDELYPSLLDEVLYAIPGLVDYQLRITRQESRDALDFKIELMPESPAGISEIDRVLLSAPVLERNIAAGRMANPQIEIVVPGALRSAGRAKKMIVDRR